MRKVAVVRNQEAEFRRVMLYVVPNGGGVYLFLYRTHTDGPSDADYWYETVDEAEAAAIKWYGVDPPDWETIPDPLPGGKHDRD